ncbi:mitochondrial thiamine pyrophosphate carrier-like [Chelonus insularis]|uniref:mitochondrial thiamine pyrophosphate carrier-like n=1 Tax=Chelonus insularis TaxID=460826 RepID=UPI00158A4211|nr:mitochondrial thiamine pyrophosphate carrier-like [Chelonus insularis]XP_034936731.1 mitochondrial thiamine pyrophosphate carrier-like [Chelonus insularis]XP_034936732.1 mitochondrial thiamine pyrophosphate carrier-like [Chelonus insularis]XP_034936733.1 mitochondrial thiamine pyrophosphate carrier-like [Chelonus insularis]
MTSPKDINNHNSDHAIAGAISGFSTRLICQPLDVIKIRFQLQVEPISHRYLGKYKSFLHATSTIIKEEGVLALWKGHVPAQLLSISYGMIQFYSYKKIVYLINDVPNSNNWQHSTHFIAGAIAGTFATAASFPFDTARTRLVAQSSRYQVYSGIFSCYESILKTESVRALFRGLLPTLVQIIPYTGTQFLLYNLFTNIYKKMTDESEISVTNSMLSGSASGLVAKTVVYPLDLARKRLQIQGFEHGRQGFGKFFTCNGFVDCVLRTIEQERFLGLFKGLIPSQTKATVTSALYFTFYEQACILLRYLRS